MKRLAIWICLIAIALYCFTYTFNVHVTFEDAFNLLVGTLVSVVQSIYEHIRSPFGWLWGDGNILTALDYIADLSGLSDFWEVEIPGIIIP